MAAETETTVEDAAGHDAATLGQHEGSTVEAAHSAGLPQFELQHWAGQIGYLLILFAVLYILMSRVFAPRIRRVFDERAETINGALASARTVQTEANAQADAARKALDEARANAQRTAAEAKAKAAKEASERQAGLEAQLNAKLAEAETRIRASRDAAMSSVNAVATEAAQAIFEKLTGQPAAEESVKAATANLQG